MNKVIIRLTAAILLPVGLIFSLYFHSKHQKADGGFTRYFIPHAISLTKSSDLLYNSYYFSGVSQNILYLGNTTAHRYLLLINQNLNQTDSLSLELPSWVDPFPSQLRVNSKEIFFSDGSHGKLWNTRFPSNKMDSIGMPGISIFTACLPINAQTVIFRTYSQEMKKSMLTKLSIGSSTSVKTADLLERYVDGYFSCDGTLCWDEENHLLIYVYRYRNLFMVADTNLNVIYRSHTIDTILTPNLKIGVYQTNNIISTTFSAPPNPINNMASSSDGLLYVLSTVKANNESYQSFKQFSTIDVYALKDGHYKFSFYLPEMNGKKIKDFLVTNHKVFALYDHSIKSYTLTFK